MIGPNDVDGKYGRANSLILALDEVSQYKLSLFLDWLTSIAMAAVGHQLHQP